MSESLPNELIGGWYVPASDVSIIEVCDPRADEPGPLGDTGGLAITGKIAVSYTTWVDGEPTKAEVAGRPIQVTVTWGEGLTPSQLQRLPWKRYLAIADASRRQDPEAGMRALLGKRPEAPKKRGPKGHGPEFYAEVAKEYLAVRARGIEAPDKAIANKRGVNRNTVAGWIRKCRDLGLLPPARPGRAG